jgi:hypothetical protein
MVFDSDNKLIREDEIEYVRTMLENRVKELKGAHNHEEIQKICAPYIIKAYNTIELITKESL